MKIQLFSDLHLETGAYQPDNINADVIVMAGDIHSTTSAIDWIAARYKTTPVIYVLGNHEYYHDQYPSLITEMKSKAKKYLNIHVLENDCVTIGGINFLGCTLWSDFKINGIESLNESKDICQRGMNDFHLVRKANGERFTPDDAAEAFAESVNWLTKSLDKLEGQTNVVVTHHVPHYDSVHQKWRGSQLTPGFVSDLSALIKQTQPALWLHGHMHDSFDYQVGTTRVVCNPRGYCGDENVGHDSGLGLVVNKMES